jgi:hypothetical protein
VIADPSVFEVGASQASSVPPPCTTLNTVDADMPAEDALIVVVPAATAVARPFDPAALLMVATLVAEELHVTTVVRSCVEPFEYVPVAEYCTVPPMDSELLRGEMEIDVNVAAVTVKVADPEMPPDVAVIVTVPALTPVARPFEPEVLLTVARAVFDEDQVAEEVRFCVDPFVYVPVAVNCWVVPAAMLGDDGVTAIETRVAEVTVRVVAPEIPPDDAVMVADPVAADVASPWEPEVLLMPATLLLEDAHVTAVVRSWVLPSE